ncbi:stage II sporulation protein M [Melghirimyces profundicolus]|uniref:stage II sporulation protein M n=1 Tax=Melghirimyces profundicolus TaxID=1242148 RepID=UPI001474035F|nr:stage II sporulation protein M [Melghirimyces profundicolus]
MGRFWNAIRSEKRNITFAALVFVFFTLVGYFYHDLIGQWMKQAGVWDQFEQKAEAIQENPGLWNTFGLIFFNNLLASVSMIFLGIFLGIYPLLGLTFNGLLVGVVLGSVSQQAGISPLTLFATRILPHGVLELPAVIFAAAYGIRLGALVVRSLAALLSPSGLGERHRSAWRTFFARIPVLFGGVAVMLIVAALIESSLIVYFSK